MTPPGSDPGPPTPSITLWRGVSRTSGTAAAARRGLSRARPRQARACARPRQLRHQVAEVEVDHRLGRAAAADRLAEPQPHDRPRHRLRRAAPTPSRSPATARSADRPRATRVCLAQDPVELRQAEETRAFGPVLEVLSSRLGHRRRVRRRGRRLFRWRRQRRADDRRTRPLAPPLRDRARLGRLRRSRRQIGPRSGSAAPAAPDRPSAAAPPSARRAGPAAPRVKNNANDAAWASHSGHSMTGFHFTADSGWPCPQTSNVSGPT